MAAGVLTPPPIAANDEAEAGTLLAQTRVGSSRVPDATGLDSPTQEKAPSVDGPPAAEDPDVTSLPAPEYAATLVAPTNRRATDRGRTTATGRLTAASRGGKNGPLEVGQDFGPRYHIIRVLGVGGMGAVYQAWDAELTEAVAVKVIRPEIAEDPRDAQEIERRFKRELLLARQVTHKNVVRIHDLGEIDGIKYITMTYVVGEDLATVLKQEGKLPVPRALRIARGLVAGLVSAHQAGVVHRDLKPANIMIGDGDQPTIMDFGIARSAGRDSERATQEAAAGPGHVIGPGLITGNTVAGAIIGTVEYMAPEQARGQPADQRSDVYAFGLILYDMLIGRKRKQKAESALAEMYARMEKAPPAPCSIDPKIPGRINAIVLRCLEPDAGKRFQTSAELLSALDRLDENGKPLPIMRRISRRTMAVAAMLVLTLLGGTFYVAKWLLAPPKVHDPVSVVIADVLNTTGDTTFDNTLGQTLRRALEDASFISAYDRTRIRSTLGMQPPEKLDEVAAREVAIKQGLGVVLAASIAPSGGGYDIAVKALQTVTGNELVNATGRASSKDQVLETSTRLMARVRGVLGDETSESAQLFAMRSLSTSSLPVVSLYAAAVEAQAKGQFEEARQSYLKAVELDPKFGLGYQGLAVMSRNLGRLDDADKYIKEALRYLDGMTERERFGTRGFYYRLIGDNQQCAKEYGESLVKYPADSVAHNQRATCLAKLRDMRGAMTEMRQAVQMLPNHAGYRTNLALFANLAGDFQAADDEVNALPQPDARALLALAYSQVGRGMLPEATATYEKIGTMGTPGRSSAAAGLGDLAVYEGRFSDAVRLFAQGAAADLESRTPDRAAIKYVSIAYAQLMAGQNESAIASAEKALLNSKGMPVRFLAARIFVEAGAIDKARPLAAALSAELPAEPQAHGKIIEGQIALKSKNAREAIKILTDANATLDTWLGHFDLGRAYLAAGAFPQADSEFDRCLARRGEALSLMDEGPTFGHVPPVYYYQGRVREELKTASFADSYREYLKIRGASTDDPLLAEVRRRAGR